MATIIREVETTAGFLEKRKVTFKTGLNCVIGARGTCKSTIVETLRFAFPQDTNRDLYIQKHPSEHIGAPEHLSDLPGRGIIAATLSPGSVRVKLEINGEEFTVERDTIPAGTLRVFKNGSVPWSDTNYVVQQAEIYSQGELYLVAKDPERRLALVDRPNISEIQSLKKTHGQLLERIAAIGQELRVHRGEIQRRKSATAQLPTLLAGLSQLQKEKPDTEDGLQREHEAYLIRERLRERVETALRETAQQIQALTTTAGALSDYGALANELDQLEFTEAKSIAKYLRDVATTSREVQRLTDGLNSGAVTSEPLRERLTEASTNYFSLLNEAEERQEQLKKEAAYREEIARYEQLVEESKRIESMVQTLLAERDDKRLQAKTARSKILELRSAEIGRINQQFHNRILLTLQPPTELPAYRQELKSLLQGSSLRDQDLIAAEVARLFSPEQLVRVVESQDANHMANLLDRELAQVNRLLAHLADHKDLYQLESVTTDDVLEITLYDKGRAKGMSELSKGQMATALLPLILRDDECPLIIDQPEDDLDNSFIFETLVQLVNQLKIRRQLIFVTHNANLPVLGDADSVIVMQMEGPLRAGNPEYGNVLEQRENILRLLEGGEEAFEARAERYGL